MSDNSDSNNAVCSIIPVSMLTFSPGELSTTSAGVHEMIPEGMGPYANRPLYPPQPYNLADLPCPPQSIMVSVLAVQLENSADHLAGGKLVYTRAWRAISTRDCYA